MVRTILVRDWSDDCPSVGRRGPGRLPTDTPAEQPSASPEDGTHVMATVKRADAGTRVVLRAVVYYIVLIGGTSLLWRFLPHGSAAIPASLEALLGTGTAPDPRVVPPLDEVTLAVTVAVAMADKASVTRPMASRMLMAVTFGMALVMSRKSGASASGGA